MLGAIFFCAFASLGVQVRGLLGERGIAPVASLMAQVREKGADVSWLDLPSLFWLNAGDHWLVGGCVLGCILSILLLIGWSPGACSLALWGLYLSYCTVGSPFLNFQWDALLLETALLAAVFLPWRWRPDWTRETTVQRLGRWLLWWLIFRLMLESGIVKLSSGDETWRGLSALSVHFETQPLPLPTAWLAHQLPSWILVTATLVMFVIELAVPFLVFVPRARPIAAWSFIALQVGILLTGNYAFFNWLTIALSVLLLPDHAWPKRWPALLSAKPAPSPRGAFYFMGSLAVFTAFVTAMPMVSVFRTGWTWPAPFSSLQRAVAPFMSFNAYGLFAVMTTTRPEIVVEGSMDGRNWNAYEFRWKPGDLRSAPCIVAPHQPRLDWQMWFAALGSYQQNPWFINFLVRLLEGSPETLELLAWNPFPQQPPRYIRAVLYEYHFTRFGEGEGRWWKRELKGLYCPAFSLKSVETQSAAQ